MYDGGSPGRDGGAAAAAVGHEQAYYEVGICMYMIRVCMMIQISMMQTSVMSVSMVHISMIYVFMMHVRMMCVCL